MLWRVLMEQFLKSRVRGDGTARKECRPKTLRAYRQDIERFVVWLEERGHAAHAETRRSDVRDYVDTLSSTGWADASRHKHLRSLRAFLRWIENDEDCQEGGLKNFRSSLPKIPYGHPREFLPTMKEISALRDSLRTSRLEEHRDYALITLLVDTGMRIGEAALLELSHLNLLKEGIISVPQGGKTGSRIVPVSPLAQKILTAWLARRKSHAKCDRIFISRSGKPMSPGGFGQAFRKYHRRMPSSRIITPHTIRHAFASYFLANGGDLCTLQGITGHSTLQQLSWYVHRVASSVQAKHAKSSPLRGM